MHPYSIQNPVFLMYMIAAAIMILKLLAFAPVADRRCGMAGQHDEPVLALRAGAHDDQRVMPHVAARAGHAVGQQHKRIGRAKLRPIDAHRHIVVSHQRHREFRPAWTNGAGVFAQRRRDIDAHAVDVNVQLILRASVDRIDRQPECIARPVSACASTSPMAESGASKNGQRCPLRVGVGGTRPDEPECVDACERHGSRPSTCRTQLVPQFRQENSGYALPAAPDRQPPADDGGTAIRRETFRGR